MGETYPTTIRILPFVPTVGFEDGKEGNHDFMVLFTVVGSPATRRRESSAQADITSGCGGKVY
jgi:hypothetical protein